MKDSIHTIIKEAVGKVRLIDTHEHLPQEKERTAKDIDLLETILIHYASSDLISAGMAPEELQEVRDVRSPLEARFRKFMPFWERIQNTGYARAINIAARDLYSVDGIGENTYKELASRMKEANRKGIYKWILKDRSGIDLSILDGFTSLEEVDKEYFAPVMRFDDFAMAKERKDIEALGREFRRPIHSFPDLVQALECKFERASRTVVGIKIALAYMRDLRFDKVSEREAEEVFVNIYNQELLKADWTPEGISLREARPYQDFVVHKVIQLARERGLPVQIHTGLQEGNENIITNSNPTLLINLFREYKDIKFDLFHGSYPYAGELATLAKNFQNVYIDMCWLHIISPHGARQALAEWLDTVPWNKIFGFGGDYAFAEGAYGHSVIARENVARVLTEKVEEGSFTEDQAVNIAQRLLRDNAHEFFFGRRGNA